MKILKFGSKKCLGCRVMKPRFKEIEKENPWLETEYYEAGESEEIIKKYKIDLLPTFIFLDKNGSEFNRLFGEIEKKEIVKIIERNKNR